LEFRILPPLEFEIIAEGNDGGLILLELKDDVRDTKFWVRGVKLVDEWLFMTVPTVRPQQSI
jgi:hypothetical protein